MRKEGQLAIASRENRSEVGLAYLQQLLHLAKAANQLTKEWYRKFHSTLSIELTALLAEGIEDLSRPHSQRPGKIVLLSIASSCGSHYLQRKWQERDRNVQLLYYAQQTFNTLDK